MRKFTNSTLLNCSIVKLLKIKKQFSGLAISFFLILISSLPFGEGWGGAFAQDIHFSQFYASPLTLNPAMTGVIKNDFRFVGNFKSQWSSINTSFTKTTYSTFSASFDMVLFRGFKKGDLISAGAVFFNDKAGDSELSTTISELSVAYNMSLGEGIVPHIVIGLQGGMRQRTINYSNLQFPNQADPFTKKYNPNIPSGESNLSDSRTYPDISAGGLWYYSPNENFNIYAGAALFHINKPNQSFMGEEDRLYRKLVLHGGSQFPIAKNIDLIPAILFLKKGKENEFDWGTFLEYTLARYKKEKTSVSIGMWHRIGDALIPVARFNYNDYTIGISYDTNLSTLTKASQLRGGPEISLIYNGNLPKVWKKNRERARTHCPRF